MLKRKLFKPAGLSCYNDSNTLLRSIHTTAVQCIYNYTAVLPRYY